VKARGSETTVIVQSNPVELGVSVFADELGRHRVLGAGSWNDTLRFRRELAIEFGVQRPDVTASMVGEHGSNMVPLWIKVRVRGVSRDRVEDVIGTIREGRTLTDFASEIDHHKAYILRLIGEGDSFGAYEVLSLLTPDLRAAVKPFFIHFTSGRTTEISTANSVTDILRSLIHGDRRLVNAQVALDGEWGDITGILGCQVMLDGRGWRDVVDMELADDETAALRASASAIASSIAAARS
jgi:malate dehydrogenase